VRFSSGRSRRCSSSTSARTSRGVFAGGWVGYLEERATARRHAEEAFTDYQDKRRALEDRARSQRQWAVQGASREKKNPKDNDKAQRDFRLNRTEKQAAKVRVTEKALDRLDVVDKPWRAGTSS